MILLARRAEALQKIVDAAKEASTSGGKVAGIQLDVSDKEQVSSIWEKIPQDLRSVDVLGKLTICVFMDTL